MLRSDDETRVIAINLPAGEQLQEHQTHERAYLVVAAGEVEVEQGGETVTGGPGFLAHFEPNERREVRATSDARLILMLVALARRGPPEQRAEPQPPDRISERMDPSRKRKLRLVVALGAAVAPGRRARLHELQRVHRGQHAVAGRRPSRAAPTSSPARS